MSRRVVCAVFDSASELYGQPIFVPAKGAAVRSFVDEVNRQAQDNALYMHPDDFSLFELSSFDDERGTFVDLESPECLIRGKEARLVKE